VHELHHLGTPAGPGHAVVRRYLALRGGARDGACVEGHGLIEAALAHGATIESLIVCGPLLRGGPRAAALVDRLVASGVGTVTVSERTFDRLSTRDGPDGLAAIAGFTTVPVGEVELGGGARVLVLDGLELPGNVGSLVRCASATGVDAVVLTGRRVRANHPLVVKASVGAIFSVPIVTADDDAALAWLRAEHVEVVAADPSATRSYRDTRYALRTAIVLGSERFGLSEFWRRAADQRLTIPMLGRVDSLNAGHAGALFLFELAHRHRESR
jgi:RNA methyltransferase, TrmH family